MENKPILKIGEKPIFNKYKIFWAFFEPLRGVVTLKDQRKIEGNRYTTSWRGEPTYCKHFPNKQKAVEFIEKLKGRLSKEYRVTLCTDAQFGLKKEGEKLPPFTKKQLNEQIIIK